MLLRSLATIVWLGTLLSTAHAASGTDTDRDGLADSDELGLVGTDPNDLDSDGDGVPDGQDDQDADGLNNLAEIAAGTDPQEPDSDGDGLNDYRELKAYRTDPLARDSDRDGLADGDEVLAFGTDPNDADSDDDGLPDGQEVDFYKTDPMAADTDGDGVGDGDETLRLRTNPLLADSDLNGVSDGDEDADGDGLSNHQEWMVTGTDPIVRDSDLDGTLDGDEDADGDGLGAAEELAAGTDLTLADTDGDGLSDGEEVHTFLTSPLDRDSDGDGLTDPDETAQGDVDPNDADSDDDGVIDGAERRWYEDSDGDGLINAMDPDADGDGVLDGTEMGVESAHADTNAALGYFVADADPRTTTDMLEADSDGGGVPDGVEDSNHDGRVDAGERDPADRLDDGVRALILIDALPDGDPRCANGGRVVSIGFDDGEGLGEPADGVLSPDEVDASTVVCDGVDGLVSLTTTSELPIGDTHCDAGGMRVDAGIDEDRDGALAASEIDSSAFVCDVEIEARDDEGCASGGGSSPWVMFVAMLGCAGLERRRSTARSRRPGLPC